MCIMMVTSILLICLEYILKNNIIIIFYTFCVILVFCHWFPPDMVACSVVERLIEALLVSYFPYCALVL